MRRPILLLLSLALLLGLGGCMPYVRQTPEEETTRITVGFSQVGAESDWRVANTESMRESLSEENGFELLFDNARQKQENQFKAIRTFIQQDVDYIVLAPVTETGWESVLEEARAAGIPVIIVDRQVEVDDPSLYTSWVGSNFRKTADEAVAWLSEKLKADGREDAVQILHLQGTPGSTAQLQRSAALEAGVAAHADWTIAAQLNGDFTQAKAYEETIAYLQSSPAPDVVYCENDNMCFGVMQALDERGIAYGDGGVTLISFDAGRTALSYCKDGKIDLCAECNPLHGPRVRALIEQLARGETPEKLSYMPEALFTADTLTAELLGSSAYSAKSVEPETVCALSDICYLFCGAVECGYSQVGTDYRERQGGKASSGPDVANGAALRQIRRDGCGIGEVLCYYLIKAADGGDVQPTALVEHIAEQYIKPLLRLLREQLSEPCLVKAPPQRRKKALSVGQRRQLSYFFFCTHMYLRCRVFESGASESEI